MEAASPHSLLRHGTAMEDRQLFDLPSSFDFYDGACSSSCGNVADGNLTPFLNTCPKCPVKYNAQHCNHCCQDGASSLRLRWHGCPGSFVLATNAQASEDCSIKEESLSAADGVRFIDCSCYDGINKPAKFNPSSCTLSDSITLKSTKSRTSDICIVSVADTVEGIAIDFSKPLPSVIGLVLTAPVGEDTTSPLWNPYPLTTYFDTTCKSKDASTAPYVLPIFPGYGKFPNTCPSAGFIDLETAGTPFLPAGVDHFDGRPPTESFWFEFVDGTSTAFWPQQGSDDSSSYYFEPNFATCSCTECPTTLSRTPTASPTARPSLAPTPEETPGRNPGPGFESLAPTTPRNPGPPGGSCTDADFEQCNAFAITNCRTNGLGGAGAGDICIYSEQTSGRRVLETLKNVIAITKPSESTFRESLKASQWATNGWIQHELQRHVEASAALRSSIYNGMS